MNVIICKSCKGGGTVEQYRGYRNEYDTVKCTRCNGTGRLLTRTYTVEFPFGTSTSITYKFDNQIIEWIRLIPKFLDKDNHKNPDGSCADCISMLKQTGKCYCDEVKK